MAWATGIPATVVEFIAKVGGRQTVYHLWVGGWLRIRINGCQVVRLLNTSPCTSNSFSDGKESCISTELLNSSFTSCFVSLNPCFLELDVHDKSVLMLRIQCAAFFTQHAVNWESRSTSKSSDFALLSDKPSSQHSTGIIKSLSSKRMKF